MASTFKNKQITANVGLYFVSNKLSRLGWNVMPTSRNAMGIDVLAYDEAGMKVVTVQVKSHEGTEAVGFDKIPHVMADFYVIVSLVYTDPTTYILTAREVKDNLTPRVGMYWLEKKDYKLDKYKEKWNKIGSGWIDPAKRRIALGP